MTCVLLEEVTLGVDAAEMRDWERLFRLAARATSTKMSSCPRAHRLIDDDDGVRGDFQLMAERPSDQSAWSVLPGDDCDTG